MHRSKMSETITQLIPTNTSALEKYIYIGFRVIYVQAYVEKSKNLTKMTNKEVINII